MRMLTTAYITSFIMIAFSPFALLAISLFFIMEKPLNTIMKAMVVMLILLSVCHLFLAVYFNNEAKTVASSDNMFASLGAALAVMAAVVCVIIAVWLFLAALLGLSLCIYKKGGVMSVVFYMITLAANLIVNFFVFARLHSAVPSTVFIITYVCLSFGIKKQIKDLKEEHELKVISELNAEMETPYMTDWKQGLENADEDKG